MNTKRTRALSVQRHKELGDKLHEVRSMLSALACELSPIYGVTGKVTKRAEDAQRAVDELRCQLDTVLAGEHPQKWNASIYYGERQAVQS